MRQDALAGARGQVALGLIQVYRGLGGGWEIRLNNEEPTSFLPLEVPAAGNAAEGIPMPAAEVPLIPAPLPKPAAQKPIRDPVRLPKTSPTPADEP